MSNTVLFTENEPQRKLWRTRSWLLDTLCLRCLWASKCHVQGAVGHPCPQYQKVLLAGEADFGVSGHLLPRSSHSGRVFHVRKPPEEDGAPRNTFKVLQMEVGIQKGGDLGTAFEGGTREKGGMHGVLGVDRVRGSRRRERSEPQTHQRLSRQGSPASGNGTQRSPMSLVERVSTEQQAWARWQ